MKPKSTAFYPTFYIVYFPPWSQSTPLVRRAPGRVAALQCNSASRRRGDEWVAMGLFGDLPDATGDGDGSSGKTIGKHDGVVSGPGGWSGAGSKLRAPTRRPPPTLPSAHVLKAQASALRAQQAKLARAIAETQGASTEKSGDAQSGAHSAGPSGSQNAEPFVATWGTMSATIEDEYLPSVPNGYEALARSRAALRETEAMDTQREARRLVLEGRRVARAALARAEAWKRGEGDRVSNRQSLDVTGEEAYLARATLGNTHAGDTTIRDGIGETSSGDKTGAIKKDDFAWRMMKKMGWKEGRGLGKQDQGMTTPLEVKRDSARGGTIVKAPEKKIEL